MIQTCPICNKPFYVSNFIAHKKYCSETCKLRAKSQRKRGRDDLVKTLNPDEYFEVGHRPTAAQLTDIATYMLGGNTKLPSIFTGVMVKWTPPQGIIWSTSDDGRGFLALDESNLIAELQASGAQLQQVVTQGPREIPMPPRDVAQILADDAEIERKIMEED